MPSPDVIDLSSYRFLEIQEITNKPAAIPGPAEEDVVENALKTIPGRKNATIA
jgi:hypothetical protein